MIYLASQMALFLVLAALTGLIVGWWSNQLRNRATIAPRVTEHVDEPTSEDIFAIKNRLDKCFDDNAKLRRDLKKTNNQLQKNSNSHEEADGSSSVDHLSDKIVVLMDDLQLRDDTILVLEKELEAARKGA